MITVDKLKELLKDYPNNAVVKWKDGSEISSIAMQMDFETLILSDHRAIGYCLKCGSNVYKSPINGYIGYCPTCNEDKFSFEIENKPLQE